MQIPHLVTILNTVSHTFVPTDTLEHTKNCGKNPRKSADALPSLQVLKGSECSICSRPPSVCESEFRGCQISKTFLEKRVSMPCVFTTDKS